MIVARDTDGNIGKNGKLPWNHVKEDMKLFKQMTTKGEKPGVLMGRKTWGSIPTVHRPLPDRINIVLSTTLISLDGAHVAADTVEAIKMAEQLGIDTLWVIGGERCYCDFIDIASEVYVTVINDVFDGCDAKFPVDKLKELFEMEIEKGYKTTSYSFKFQHWVKKT